MAKHVIFPILHRKRFFVDVLFLVQVIRQTNIARTEKENRRCRSDSKPAKARVTNTIFVVKKFFTANGGPGPLEFIKSEFHLTSHTPENTDYPIMIICNVAARKYVKALEGKTDFTEANVLEFIKDYSEGKCTEKAFQSAEQIKLKIY